MSRPEGEEGRSAILAPLAVALIWGINVPVMKAGLAELDPFLFNAARLSLSALSLGLFSLREPRGGGIERTRARRGLRLRGGTGAVPRPWSLTGPSDHNRSPCKALPKTDCTV